MKEGLLYLKNAMAPRLGGTCGRCNSQLAPRLQLVYLKRFFTCTRNATVRKKKLSDSEEVLRAFTRLRTRAVQQPEEVEHAAFQLVVPVLSGIVSESVETVRFRENGPQESEKAEF